MEFLVPKTPSEALDFLREYGGRARLIAGGTNAVPELRDKSLKADALIDISNLRDLAYIRQKENLIHIGSLTTMVELTSSAFLQDRVPIIAAAARQVGNPLVRNRATIGGNLVDASPAADLAIPLLALGATAVMKRAGSEERRMPIEEFFLGPRRTALAKDEMLIEISFFIPERDAFQGYRKLGLRNAMTISLASAAVMLGAERKTGRLVRIALGAVAPKPIRVYRAEEMLKDGPIRSERINACCEAAVAATQPISDIRASADYRKEMTAVIVKRLLLAAAGMEKS
jgi:CO/xanthine dehydrogenase FAD-binding subunit